MHRKKSKTIFIVNREDREKENELMMLIRCQNDVNLKCIVKILLPIVVVDRKIIRFVFKNGTFMNNLWVKLVVRFFSFYGYFVRIRMRFMHKILYFFYLKCNETFQTTIKKKRRRNKNYF